MNCHEFQNIVVDLVRGEVTDSKLATRCWAHAAQCSRCADRLLEQEKLAAGLEALVNRPETMLGSERIETVLRQEFKNQFARTTAGKASRPLVINVPRRDVSRKSHWAWAAVAAAVLLAPLVTILAKRMGTTQPATSTARVKAAPALNSQQPAQQSNAVATAASHATPKLEHKKTLSGSKAQQNRSGKTNPKSPAHPTYRSSTRDELATNFFPLPYGSGLTLDEGWEIVRVNMPRSELTSLGLQFPNEQALPVTITADLVLGEDGLARAIRFVE